MKKNDENKREMEKANDLSLSLSGRVKEEKKKERKRLIVCRYFVSLSKKSQM